MIHEILLAWPNLEYSFDLNMKEVKSDTIIFNVTMDGIDLTDYKIKASLTDYSKEIKLANEAAGGSDDEIVAVDGLSGESKFMITVPADATNDFRKFVYLEIEIESPEDNKFTVCKQRITFLDENIDW